MDHLNEGEAGQNISLLGRRNAQCNEALYISVYVHRENIFN